MRLLRDPARALPGQQGLCRKILYPMQGMVRFIQLTSLSDPLFREAGTIYLVTWLKKKK